MRLALDATGNGTIEVGDGPLPPPTDPDVGYPAGDPSDYVNTLAEGYAYPTHSTRVEAGRVQFGVNTYDLFSGWCALQTPIAGSQMAAAPDAGSNAGYGCIPKFPPGTSSGAGPGNAADGGGQCIIAGNDGSILASIDCGKLFLCGEAMACACTEASCTSRAAPAGLVPAQYSISLDGVLDDPPTTLTATLAMNGTRVTVHLTRE